MSDDRSLRLEAGRYLGKAFASASFRKTLDSNGYTSGSEIVLALEDDAVDAVFTRVPDAASHGHRRLPPE